MEKQKRQTRNTIIAIIILAAAVCLLWIIVLGIYGGERGGDTMNASGVDGGPGGSADHENGAEDPSVSEVERPSFYIEARSGRYEAFAAQRPLLAFDDVVWMVNVDLDKPPYEEVSEVRDPTSLTALVTKYFYLPADYSPQNLVNIGQTMMRAEAAGAMEEMINAAKAEGLRLWVQSGYRSYSIQIGLYAQYSAADGEEEADRYSARPGHSEHQTGLVADLNSITDAFGETPEGMWVAENCWQYGFIVRYTAENTEITLYKPEPWHIRYIGREAAAGMRDLGILSFEEYWVRYVS